jgi:hypothetical protein
VFSQLSERVIHVSLVGPCDLVTVIIPGPNLFSNFNFYFFFEMGSGIAQSV